MPSLMISVETVVSDLQPFSALEEGSYCKVCDTLNELFIDL